MDKSAKTSFFKPSISQTLMLIVESFILATEQSITFSNEYFADSLLFSDFLPVTNSIVIICIIAGGVKTNRLFSGHVPYQRGGGGRPPSR